MAHVGMFCKVDKGFWMKVQRLGIKAGSRVGFGDLSIGFRDSIDEHRLCCGSGHPTKACNRIASTKLPCASYE